MPMSTRSSKRREAWDSDEIPSKRARSSTPRYWLSATQLHKVRDGKHRLYSPTKRAFVATNTGDSDTQEDDNSFADIGSLILSIEGAYPALSLLPNTSNWHFLRPHMPQPTAATTKASTAQSTKATVETSKAEGPGAMAESSHGPSVASAADGSTASGEDVFDEPVLPEIIRGTSVGSSETVPWEFLRSTIAELAEPSSEAGAGPASGWRVTSRASHAANTDWSRMLQTINAGEMTDLEFYKGLSDSSVEGRLGDEDQWLRTRLRMRKGQGLARSQPTEPWSLRKREPQTLVEDYAWMHRVNQAKISQGSWRQGGNAFGLDAERKAAAALK